MFSCSRIVSHSVRPFWSYPHFSKAAIKESNRATTYIMSTRYINVGCTSYIKHYVLLTDTDPKLLVISHSVLHVGHCARVHIDPPVTASDRWLKNNGMWLSFTNITEPRGATWTFNCLSRRTALYVTCHFIPSPGWSLGDISSEILRQLGLSSVVRCRTDRSISL